MNEPKTYEYNEDSELTPEGRFNIKVWCSNCTHEAEIKVKKGTKINPAHLKRLKCPNCEVQGYLEKQFWHYTDKMRVEKHV